MKKKNLKSLKINKKSISNLNIENTKGGRFTGGCTDGCTPIQTAWNCTEGGACTGDCNGGITWLNGCGRQEE